MAYTPDEVAEIAHDLNNLLSVIAGNASFLKQMVDDASEKELVEEILKASSKGEVLVRQMLIRTRGS